MPARLRPARQVVMYEQWRDLLFLHCEYSAEAIQSTLPEGLSVDTFEYLIGVRHCHFGVKIGGA